MKLFDFCTSFLSWLSMQTKLTYREVSVYVNLYFQGGILLLSIAMVCVKAVYMNHAIIALVYGIFLGVFVDVSLNIFKRYHLPKDNEYAFQKCVHELESLSNHLGLSYQQLNILIFVVGFLFLLLVNLIVFLNV